MRRIRKTNQGHAHNHAGPDALADATVLPGAEILPHKGGHRHAEGAGDHPGDGIGFAVGGPGGHHHIPEGIDAGLDQGVGQIEGHKLQPRRDADEQDSAQQSSIQPEGGQPSLSVYSRHSSRHNQ